MSQILAVFGATGKQGSSVINHVLADPELASLFTVRAITRSTTSPAAQALSANHHNNVQVVQADMTDHASLSKALAGVHTVFAMTTPDFGPNGFETEFGAAKLIADVAIEQGVKFIIFSTLPSVKRLSGGKYTKSVHFDAKAEAEEYIRSLSPKIKSAFLAPGFFMENFHGLALVPFPDGDGGYVITLPTSPAAKLPLIDAGGDTGKFVGAILAEPDKYAGKTFVAASGLRRLDEIAAAMSESTGKKVVYRESSVAEFSQMLPPALADVMTETFKAMEEFGYAGDGTEDQVAWAVKHARGNLTSLEEYLAANPLELK